MKRILLIFIGMIILYIGYEVVAGGISFGSKNANAEVTSKIQSIELDINSIKAEIVPGKDDDVRAELSGKGEVTVKKSGDTIKVTYKRKQWIFSPFNKTAKLTVYIPESYKNDLEISAGSGNFLIEGNSAKDQWELGDVHLDISSGKADFRNLKAKELVLTGSSGIFSAKNLTAEKGDFTISSGMGTIENFSGPLKAEISSGMLTAKIAELTGDVELEASSGRLVLDLPENGDFTLNGKSNSGHISSSLADTETDHKSGSVKGVLGSGKYNVNVSVSSGSAEIK